MTVFCIFCQVANEDDSIFCQVCGKPLKENSNFKNESTNNLQNTPEDNREFILKLKSLDHPKNTSNTLKNFNTPKNTFYRRSTLLLNFSFFFPFIPYYLTNFSVQAFTNLLILPIELIIPLTIFAYFTMLENDNKYFRYLMLFVFIVVFEFSIYPYNVFLLFLSVYQIYFKGFYTQIYKYEDQSDPINHKDAIFRLAGFLILLTIIWIFFNRSYLPSNLNGYFSIVVIIILIFIIPYFRLKLNLKIPFKVSTTLAFSVLILAIIGTSFLPSVTNVIITEQDSGNYRLTNLSKDDSANINFISHYYGKLPIPKTVLIHQDLTTNKFSIVSIPQCILYSYVSCSTLSVTNNSVLVAQYNSSAIDRINPGYGFGSGVYTNFSKIIFNNEKPLFTNFTASTVIIDHNNNIWAINKTNNDLTISNIDNPSISKLLIRLNEPYDSFFISSDMSKMGIIENNGAISLTSFKLINNSTSSELFSEKTSNLTFDINHSAIFTPIQWDATTETFYYAYHVSNLDHLYQYNIMTNETSLIGSREGYWYHDYFFNEKNSLIMQKSNDEIYSYNLNNSPGIKLVSSVPDGIYWDFNKLIGLNQNNSTRVIYKINPSTFQVSENKIPFIYSNQGSMDYYTSLNQIDSELIVLNVFLCAVILIYDNTKRNRVN